MQPRAVEIGCRFAAAVVVVVATSLSAPSRGLALEDAAAAPASVPACISWNKEARYRPYGYDHIVHIRNDCSQSARCVVTTDVNPSPIAVVVAAGTEVEVVTFVGSPASAFEANVECKLVS